MGLLEIIALSIGLAMDAFAVAACKGLSMRKVTLRKMAVIGLYFGIFQAGMPLIGYFAAVLFEQQINAFDHWIAFGLLTILGVKMIKESFEKDEEDDGEEQALSFKLMLPLALATSIDAMAVGVTFALSSDVNVWVAVGFIGVITLAISMAGVKIGNIFGNKFKFGAELAGGIILILIGVKILVEDLFF